MQRVGSGITDLPVWIAERFLDSRYCALRAWADVAKGNQRSVPDFRLAIVQRVCDRRDRRLRLRSDSAQDDQRTQPRFVITQRSNQTWYGTFPNLHQGV